MHKSYRTEKANRRFEHVLSPKQRIRSRLFRKTLTTPG